MKSFRKELWFDIPKRRQLINITPDVQNALIDNPLFPFPDRLRSVFSALDEEANS